MITLIANAYSRPKYPLVGCYCIVNQPLWNSSAVKDSMCHILWYELLDVTECHKHKSNAIIYIVKHSTVFLFFTLSLFLSSSLTLDIIINCIHQVNNPVLVLRCNAPTHGRGPCQSAPAPLYCWH